LQDPTEKHFGDVGILDKYEDNNKITEECRLSKMGLYWQFGIDA
jgi:hypothetical protein